MAALFNPSLDGFRRDAFDSRHCQYPTYSFSRALSILELAGYNVCYRPAAPGDRKPFSLLDFAQNLRKFCLGVKSADLGVSGLDYRHDSSSLIVQRIN
jgi:hypothetical protein